MARVATFKVLEGDTDITIGDTGVNEYIKDFNTSDYDGGSAFLTFMVQGLTATNDRANVLVNDEDVGGIFSSHSGADSDRVTQIINIGSGFLSDDSAPDANTLRIESVVRSAGGSDQHDDFKIRNIVLHYHVNV